MKFPSFILFLSLSYAFLPGFNMSEKYTETRFAEFHISWKLTMCKVNPGLIET